jgi:hypothetical protein
MTALEDPRWLALSKERRDELLEKHRDINVHDEWWDGVYEQFIEDCTAKGIAVDTHTIKTYGGSYRPRPSIWFSGFWSQGDGACFAGRIDDWPKFLTAAGFPGLASLYEKLSHTLCLQWHHSGHYYHSGCTCFVDDLATENDYDEEEEPLLHAAWNVATENGSIFEDELEAFINYIRGLMDDLYKKLEEEHDYLTSDERIVDYLLDHCDDELVEPVTEDE